MGQTSCSACLWTSFIRYFCTVLRKVHERILEGSSLINVSHNSLQDGVLLLTEGFSPGEDSKILLSSHHIAPKFGHWIITSMPVAEKKRYHSPISRGTEFRLLTQYLLYIKNLWKPRCFHNYSYTISILIVHFLIITKLHGYDKKKLQYFI